MDHPINSAQSVPCGWPSRSNCSGFRKTHDVKIAAILRSACSMAFSIAVAGPRGVAIIF